MNTWFGIGNIVRDVELKQSQSGLAFTNFTIAINRPANKNGETTTDYINIASFGKQAENLAKYTHKGSKIAVQGRLQVRSYQNAEGKNVYVTEVLANNIQFLDNKSSNSEQAPKQVTQDPYEAMGQQIERELSENDMPW